jgi:hypothetical protein
VHPNPVTSNLTIKAANVRAVIVFNEQGHRVMKASGNLQTIDLSGLPAGVYLLEVHTDKAVLTRKIIKE